jgi:hypothetical protein
MKISDNMFGIRKKIKGWLIIYFVKKELKKWIKELREQSEENKKGKANTILILNQAIKKITEEVDVFCESLEVTEAEYGKNDEAAKIATIFPFLDLSMLDIIILCRQYLSTEDKLEQNFICRTSAQHMYEFLEDGTEVFGKQIKSLVDTLNDVNLNALLKDLRIQFRSLWSKYHGTLKELRHNVSGHKDRDVRVQLKISKSIDVKQFQQLLLDFVGFFSSVTQFKLAVAEEIQKRKTGSISIDNPSQESI